MAPSATTITQQYASIDINGKSLRVNSTTNDHGKEYGKVLTKDVLKGRIEAIDTDTCAAGEEDAFFVADMGEVYRQHLRWKMNLKRVKPHYAVKCNPDPEVLRLLAGLGTGFDCASKSEIEQVLNLGVDPSRIIYAQPCKTNSYVRFAAERGVKQMTFDNSDELYKIKRFFPDAELFLRILTDDSTSLCRLSDKFGASLSTTIDLLTLAKDLELNVTGVSFHVGSGASDPQSFDRAVRDARIIFDQAADIGYSLKTLDVGGGFSGDLFESMANVLSKALDENFPSSVRIIGEPGRYYVASAFTLACNVIARRDLRDPATMETSYMLYLNDGVYGNFSSLIFDHQIASPRILSKRDRSTRSTEYSLWGPSCDGIDRVTEICTLHGVLDVGDWLYFEEMGAYTKCSATKFNGFTDSHDVLYVSSEPGASALLNY
ncbi:MAG: Ornithine decarboxylase [Alectoria fallacina]|uniref:Ornithine decarboxylase n=1 Tax=Alectoria fallacina TaxID=1903189 RepID=A0A8H3I5M7_9LECA|nr:MAG: Ornithine decarboxylase [Alectoria fallacina]